MSFLILPAPFVEDHLINTIISIGNERGSWCSRASAGDSEKSYNLNGAWLRASHTATHTEHTLQQVQHKTGDSERSYNLNKAWLRVELTIPHTMKRCCEQQTLQHTLKTHCNTLQHTATQMEDCNTHCNTHCNTCCNAYGVAMKCC